MKTLYIVLIHTFGYYSWVFGVLTLGRLMGGKFPEGDVQWLGVIFCITVGYALLQAGLLHAKLHRIESLLKEQEKP